MATAQKITQKRNGTPARVFSISSPCAHKNRPTKEKINKRTNQVIENKTFDSETNRGTNRKRTKNEPRRNQKRTEFEPKTNQSAPGNRTGDVDTGPARASNLAKPQPAPY
jgi:hypothetical protein